MTDIARKLLLGLGAAFALAIASLTFTGALIPIVSEAQTASTTLPSISNLTATSTPDGTGETIMWDTDIPDSTQIEYGTTTNYGFTSTLANATSSATNHFVTLFSLLPNTLYHFAILLTGSSTASSTPSADQTFVTASSTATASSTLPMISNIMASSTANSATVTWNTDLPASTQLMYGTTTSYGASTTLDSATTTTHTATLSSLNPSTTYHFQVLSGNDGGMASSSDQTLMTLASTTTGTTTTSSDVNALIALLQGLQTTYPNFAGFIQGLINQLSPGNTTGNTGSATVDQNGASFSAGGTIDFGGRNFGHEEQVTVKLNGNTVTTAHADGGGNFSTGSLSLPTTAGTYTYSFTGQTSGMTAQATITTH